MRENVSVYSGLGCCQSVSVDRGGRGACQNDSVETVGEGNTRIERVECIFYDIIILKKLIRLNAEKYTLRRSDRVGEPIFGVFLADRGRACRDSLDVD